MFLASRENIFESTKRDEARTRTLYNHEEKSIIV